MKISTAFQPIIDIEEKKVFSYEALARGEKNEPIETILRPLKSKKDFLNFDKLSRFSALNLASRLRIPCYLNLNFLPSSLEVQEDYLDEILKQNLFDCQRIIIEVTENERIISPEKFGTVVTKCREMGIKIAIDDFGAGYSGLNTLVGYLPDFIKLDIKLIKNIHAKGPQQSTVKAILQVCEELGIEVIAEGVEDVDEYKWLKEKR